MDVDRRPAGGETDGAPAALYSNDELQEYKDAFKLFDKDDDGTITIEELQVVFTNLNFKFSTDALKKMVATVDDNSDGQIDLKEFMAMMKSKVTRDVGKVTKSYKEELKEAFGVFDQDGDGYITAKEELKEAFGVFDQDD